MVRRTPTSLRGHFAERMRALSESHGMSLAKLLKDTLLVYEGEIDGGYEPGTSLRRWQESAANSEQRAESRRGLGTSVASPCAQRE